MNAMKSVDMSDKAVTARLKRVQQLRRLGLSLQKAKLRTETPEGNESNKTPQPTTQKPNARKRS